MNRLALLKRDPAATEDFFDKHADLIGKHIQLRKTEGYMRFPIRNELAALAREAFGYSDSTAASDIVYRIVRMYLKNKAGRG